MLTADQARRSTAARALGAGRPVARQFDSDPARPGQQAAPRRRTREGQAKLHGHRWRWNHSQRAPRAKRAPAREVRGSQGATEAERPPAARGRRGLSRHAQPRARAHPQRLEGIRPGARSGQSRVRGRAAQGRHAVCGRAKARRSLRVTETQSRQLCSLCLSLSLVQFRVVRSIGIVQLQPLRPSGRDSDQQRKPSRARAPLSAGWHREARR